MKVFFHASPFADKFDKQIHAFYDEIEKLGYQHINTEPKTHSVRSLLTNKDEENIKKDYNKHIESLLSSIRLADICIFEVSFQSLGIGYLVEKSIEQSKPTIVLYFKGNTPYIFSFINDEKLIVEKYDDKNYKKVIKDALDKAREKRDKRFNFFLSPKLLQYIDDASRERGITKSKLLRDMIVNHMRTNQEESVE